MDRDFITRGFLLAVMTGPLLAGGAFSVGMFTSGASAYSLQTFSYALITLFYSLLFGTIVSFPSCLLLGVPVHLGLKRLGWQHWLPYVLSGALAGGLIGPVVIWHAIGSVICGFLGAASALVFWWAGVRPDKKQSLSRKDTTSAESLD